MTVSDIGATIQLCQGWGSNLSRNATHCSGIYDCILLLGIYNKRRPGRCSGVRRVFWLYGFKTSSWMDIRSKVTGKGEGTPLHSGFCAENRAKTPRIPGSCNEIPSHTRAQEAAAVFMTASFIFWWIIVLNRLWGIFGGPARLCRQRRLGVITGTHVSSWIVFAAERPVKVKAWSRRSFLWHGRSECLNDRIISGQNLKREV